MSVPADHPSSPPLRPWRRVALLTGVLVLTGCAEPELPDEIEPTPITAEETVDEPELDDELRAQLATVQATLTELREALTGAQEADTVPQAQTQVDRAFVALLGDPDGGSGAVPPLLPSETVDRTESPTAPDLLTATLSIAQDLSGSLGRDVADALRDPLAGDLGAWQRDPAGMVALAQETAASATDLGALEPRILELDGEGTRALAWVFVARDADDLATVQGAAERALAHVRVIEVAIDDVLGGA